MKCSLKRTAVTKNRTLAFFGRAGYVDPRPSYMQSRTLGTDALYWSSVAPSGTDGFNLYFNATGVYPSVSRSRAYGFPLRCLAHGTAG